MKNEKLVFLEKRGEIPSLSYMRMILFLSRKNKVLIHEREGIIFFYFFKEVKTLLSLSKTGIKFSFLTFLKRISFSRKKENIEK